MIRRFGKTLYARAYSWTRTARRSADPQSGLPFIVGYHRVVENFNDAARHAIPSMLTSTAMLERHVDWLAKNYRLLSLDELGQELAAGSHSRKRAAAITFDDGYGDVYRNAFPILKRKGIPAAVFVVSGVVGTNHMQVYDKLYLLLSQLQTKTRSVAKTMAMILPRAGVRCPELRRLHDTDSTLLNVLTALLTTLPQRDICKVLNVLESEIHVEKSVFEELAPLSWPMIDEMHRNGITIGSHTISHPLLTQESDQRIETEIADSKLDLETRLKSDVKHFAYPDGRFNSTVVDRVKSAGYQFAYGICRARDARHPLLTIPRTVLWENACVNTFGRFSPAVMDCQAFGAFDAGRRCEHDHGVTHVEIN
jgi:peptidoglycan/xylan/chitin deacetylase (PgdA/CDA1 family)